MRSTPRWRRFSSTCWRRYSGRPTGIHWFGPWRVCPTLVAMTRSSGIRMQRLADQRVGDERAVGVGGVDQVDAELDCPAQHADGGVVVGRLAPDARAGQLHGSEAETVDRQIAAELEGAGRFGGRCVVVLAVVVINFSS